MKRTKWLRKLFDKVTDASYKGGTFTCYGHQINVMIGYWGDIEIFIDHKINIDIDPDMCEVVCYGVPKHWHKPIMQYLNELYSNYPFNTDKFTKLIIDD